MSAGARTTEPHLDDLSATLSEAWRRLERGAADRRVGFHTLQLATLGLDGRPRLRTVVLRAVSPSARLIRVHTDARSPKVAELARDGRIALLGYDAPAALQVRLEGRAEVVGDGPLHDAAWAATRPMSRVCYRVASAPGSPISAPLHGVPPVDVPDPEAGREVFRLVLCRIERLDWLHLAHDGHRRAAFAFDDAGAVTQAGWRVP